MSPEFLLAESVGRDVSPLADLHLADVGFVNVYAHAQRLAIADGKNWIRHSGGIRHALTGAMMLAQYSPLNGRTNERLPKARLRFVQLGLGQLQISLGERPVFFAGMIVHQRMLLHGGFILGVGYVRLAGVPLQL